MTRSVIEKRLNTLEAEVRLLRKAVKKQPNLSIDEKNWKSVKPTVKKVRSKLYKARYA